MHVERRWEFQENGFTLSAIRKAIFIISSAREKKSGTELWECLISQQRGFAIMK